MKRTDFSFNITFLTDNTDEFIKKLESFKGVEQAKIVGNKSDADLVINVVFDNSETAKKLHRKIMNFMIKSKDSIIVRSAKSILSDIF